VVLPSRLSSAQASRADKVDEVLHWHCSWRARAKPRHARPASRVAFVCQCWRGHVLSKMCGLPWKHVALAHDQLLVGQDVMVAAAWKA
jgi:hypothetical protein